MEVQCNTSNRWVYVYTVPVPLPELLVEVNRMMNDE